MDIDCIFSHLYAKIKYFQTIADKRPVCAAVTKKNLPISVEPENLITKYRNGHPAFLTIPEAIK